MKTEKLPRAPGRPRSPPDKGHTARAELRLTPAQKAKLKLLGGPDWIRDCIDKAKIPARPAE